MANHARDSRSAANDKRAALAGAQRNAYSHRDQVGGTRKREADGRWVDRREEPVRQRPKPLSQQSLGEFIANNIVYVLSVIAVIVIVLMLIIGVRAFSGLTESLDEPGEYVTPYDWSQLDRSTGHYAYVVNGQVKSRLGVDVSEHDGYIDWNAVASDGVEFAIIRLGYRGATEGTINLDEYYEYNMEAAKAAGLDVGVYFFSQAITPDEAREEAAYVLSVLGGTELDYPIVFDWERVSGVGETRTTGLVSTELSAVADAFCSEIEASGHKTILYGNPIDMDHYSDDVLKNRAVWWAEYGTPAPQHDVDIELWQYTSSGSVAGIDGDCDLNLDLYGVLS